MSDTFDLQRFVDAQEPVIETALEELRAGRKQTHWMWFVFPQLRGLGSSTTATFYGLESLAEARAYLAHETLGVRLALCTQMVLDHEGSALRSIFSPPDDMKFRSCMTLFSVAANHSGSVFNRALERLCDGMDERSLTLIERREQPTVE